MTNKLLRTFKGLAVQMRGFTLIETLLAVLLLSTAIAGPLTIASKGLSTAVIAKDQVGAYNLAQDAMEYIRFVRDTNRLSGGNWLTGVGASSNGVDLSSCEGASGCYIDSIQSTVSACSGTCPVMNYDSTNHYYSYTTGAPSSQRYIRTITIKTPVGSNSDEATVTIVVGWTGVGNIAHSVTITEDLFNWE